MKLRISTMLILGIISLSPALSAYSAKPPVVGGACNKLGLAQTYLGKKYTCIKSGKKFVWSKGVVVKKSPIPTPIATPIATPIESSNPIPSSSPTPIPTPSESPTPTPSPTPTQIPVPLVIKKVFDDLAKFPMGQDAAQKVSFNFSPNADLEFSNLSVQSANNVMKFFVDFYQDPRPYPVFFGDTKDVEWVINEWAKFGYTEESQRKDLRTRAPNGITVNYWGSPQGHFTMVFSPEQIRGFGSEQQYRVTIVTHHVVHGIQSRVTGARFEYLSCWANEGGAEFYGAIVASRYMGLDYLNYRRMLIGNWVQSKPTLDLRKFNEVQWFDMLKLLEGDPFCDSSKTGNLQYNTGVLLHERLVADFGHQKVMDLWYAMRQSKDWKDNFRKTFGVDTDTWYRTSAIPYLIEQYSVWVPLENWEGIKN